MRPLGKRGRGVGRRGWKGQRGEGEGEGIETSDIETAGGCQNVVKTGVMHHASLGMCCGRLDYRRWGGWCRGGGP